MIKAMRLSLVISALIVIADQASKIWMVERIFRPDGVTETPFYTSRLIEVLPFFQLRLAWNPGISFSLFSSGEPLTVALLVVLQLSIVGVMLWWLRQATTLWMKVGIGCIVGGAFGNIIDRLHYGMVVDFLDFFAAGYHFPTFNLADSAITIGVGFWLLDAFVTRNQDDATPDPK
ncbi:MAG: signal peptidase II [Rhodospirillaceae bacterium]|nr:signal peptidase II [Rhodospirillaceae bacterium]MBT5241059.1 signal peptidase II [Rhodospirillaceae bacterium]MBT5564675.1 signal peptidase II [Rhodospirillaceae bacterium]MBT6091010.1 signal peptidase II [Rhodospirillaceae bacterium]